MSPTSFMQWGLEQTFSFSNFTRRRSSKPWQEANEGLCLHHMLINVSFNLLIRFLGVMLRPSEFAAHTSRAGFPALYRDSTPTLRVHEDCRYTYKSNSSWLCPSTSFCLSLWVWQTKGNGFLYVWRICLHWFSALTFIYFPSFLVRVEIDVSQAAAIIPEKSCVMDHSLGAHINISI